MKVFPSDNQTGFSMSPSASLLNETLLLLGSISNSLKYSLLSLRAAARMDLPSDDHAKLLICATAPISTSDERNGFSRVIVTTPGSETVVNAMLLPSGDQTKSQVPDIDSLMTICGFFCSGSITSRRPLFQSPWKYANFLPLGFHRSGGRAVLLTGTFSFFFFPVLKSHRYRGRSNPSIS